MIEELLRDIHKYLKLLRFKKKFRKANANNCVKVNRIFDMDKVKIGNFTYGNLNIHTFGNSKEYLEIGNFCSIANDVVFLLSGEHNYKNISTYPFKAKFKIVESECLCKGPIIVEDDVWIGENSIILSGVRIGKGAVIGAGSIVSHDVPPYSVFAKDRFIKKRFSDEIIERLLTIDYSKFDKDFIKENIQLFYSEINNDNIEEIINKLVNKE